MTKYRVWFIAMCLLTGSLGSFGTAGEPSDEAPFGQGFARMENNELVKVILPVFKIVCYPKEESYTVSETVKIKKIDPVTNQEQTVMENRLETRTRTVTICCLVPELTNAIFQVAGLGYFELDGTPADANSLPERLKQQTLVVVTNDGKPVPSEFVMLFKPRTLVIAMPSCSAAPSIDTPPLPPAEAPPGADAPPPPPPAPANPAARSAKTPVFFVAQNAAPPTEEPDDFALPTGLPPTFQMARIDEHGSFALSTVVAEDREVSAYVNVSKKVMDSEGEFKDVFETHQLKTIQQIRSSVTTLFPLKSVTGRTVDGNPMEDRHLSALKLRQIPVIVSRDNKPVDPVWLGNLNPKMLILVPPTTNDPNVGKNLAPAPTAAPSVPAPVAPPPPGGSQT